MSWGKTDGNMEAADLHYEREDGPSYCPECDCVLDEEEDGKRCPYCHWYSHE